MNNQINNASSFFASDKSNDNALVSNSVNTMKNINLSNIDLSDLSQETLELRFKLVGAEVDRAWRVFVDTNVYQEYSDAVANQVFVHQLMRSPWMVMQDVPMDRNGNLICLHLNDMVVTNKGEAGSVCCVQEGSPVASICVGETWEEYRTVEVRLSDIERTETAAQVWARVYAEEMARRAPAVAKEDLYAVLVSKCGEVEVNDIDLSKEDAEALAAELNQEMSMEAYGVAYAKPMSEFAFRPVLA